MMGRDKTAATYDRIAVRYAARATYPLEQELECFRHMVPTGGLVLDVGCGPGQYARALAARKLRVVGLDVSLGMLRQARALHARRETPRLIRADMRQLPIPDARVDGCFACASLLHLPRTQAPQALAAKLRELHAGGALYVGVKQGEGDAWVADQGGHERFFAYYQMEEIDRLIRAAGFEVVDGWISPPGEGQRHNWLNRFAVARP